MEYFTFNIGSRNYVNYVNQYVRENGFKKRMKISDRNQMIMDKARKMKKPKQFLIVLCTVVPLVVLFSHICVTQNFHLLLIDRTIDTRTVPAFGKSSNVSTTDIVTEKARIETVQKNHNVSRIDALLTRSRKDTIQNLYGKSWDSIITTYPTRFLIDGKNICNVSPLPFLLVFVLSLPKNTEERQAIKETWGSVVKEHKESFNVSARMMFILGHMGDEIKQHTALQEESDNHKDIVQIDLIESRYNLTRKMMSGLKWIKTYCSSVKYILKVDDDTFIDATRFSEYLLKDPNINNVTIHGWVYTHGFVWREGKYRVKVEEYPKSVFPPLTCGTAYILPFDVIPDMLDIAERVPYCPVDDAFMTGVLRFILGFKIKHSPDFTHMDERKIDPCRFYSKIAVTNISSACMHMLWNLTTQAQRIDCKRKDLYDQKVCPIFS